MAEVLGRARESLFPSTSSSSSSHISRRTATPWRVAAGGARAGSSGLLAPAVGAGLVLTGGAVIYVQGYVKDRLDATSGAVGSAAAAQTPPAAVTTFETPDEWDPESTGLSFRQHMVAGAFAGAAEHTLMFPVDTVKTRMQARPAGAPVYRGALDALRTILAREGAHNLFRGFGSVAFGAMPSHALYFSVLEFVKEKLRAPASGGGGGASPLLPSPAAAAAVSAAVATACSDALFTPVETVKQRLQLYASPYRNAYHCASALWANEGLRAFYASYPTTLAMNVPFASVHFAGYETLKAALADVDGHTSPAVHLVSGGLAGGLAACVTNPMDVVKTRLQTRNVNGSPHAVGFWSTASEVWRAEGAGGFARGLAPRAIFHTPAAAICWVTYEAVKNALRGTTPPP